MWRTFLQRYIKSSPSDIDWCVVTVVRYHVCQHFNLAACRSRSLNNWNCKYIHTCLKRSSRIIRLIRSATATFFFTKFMMNFVKISAITTITYCVLRCDGCQLRLCSLFFQHVNLSFDLIQPLFSGWARCLVTWALHISTRSKYTHFKINFMFIDLVWFKSKPNLKYDASVAVTAVAWNCDNMCSNAIAHFTFHSQPCIFQHYIFVLQEIGITLEIDVLLQWNNVYLCYCSWCFFFISFLCPKYLHATRSNVTPWNICPFDKWSHTIYWVSLIYDQ